MTQILKFLLAFLVCLTAQAQVTLSSNFTSNAARGDIMVDHLDTYNRINPRLGFRSPILPNAGIGIVRPLGGISANGSADLTRDTYRWNAQAGRFETNFTSLIEQLDRVESQGFQIHQIVLDNPSWDFQRNNRGQFPGEQTDYIVSTFGNATPPVSNDRWVAYLREAVQAIVDHLGAAEASRIQYGIGREIGTFGHWTGSQFQFFQFYRRSVEAIRSVIPNANVGSHFLWGTADDFWGVDFIGFCARNNVPYNFIGLSYYPLYNREDRTNFDRVYRDDFGVITRNRNWDSNARLEIHEFALVKSISGGTFDEAPAQHLNSFLVGMMKIFYQNGMNNLTLWGDGSQYGPAYSTLRSLVGNRFYTNAKSGNQRFEGNFVNGIFSRNERDNSYDVMVYNYSDEVRRNQGRGTGEDIIIRATINSAPGTRYRWRTIAYNPNNNRTTTSAFQERTTVGSAGSRNSRVELPSRRLSGYSWVKYEFNVVAEAAAPAPEASDDITGTWFRLRNRFTNRYLDGGDRFSLGTQTSPTGFDRQFRFIRRGNFYNIDIRRNSSVNASGILQAIDNNARNVVVTNREDSFDNDKQWTIQVNSNGVATFKNRARNAYLRDNGGTATHDPTNDTNHTRWTLERVGSVSSKSLNDFGTLSEDAIQPIFAYPNPSSDGIFTLNTDTDWEVYNIKGQKISSGAGAKIDLSAHQRGIYILKADATMLRLVF